MDGRSERPGEDRDVTTAAPLSDAQAAPRYERGPLLGQGGMGEVFLNQDHVIGRHVARKTLLREGQSDRTFALFVREARVQGQLEHPSVVPVYDFGVGDDGVPFFTMKRVRGETLSHILEALADRDAEYLARFSRHRLLAAFRQVCLAIEYAHLRGVVHRDLKPSNIMLGDFGEVYVLDWGLAKLRSDLEGPPDSSLRGAVAANAGYAQQTGSNAMVGTPAYMAPEQFGAGRNTFDTRQDVFAIGAILFEILTLTRYRPGTSFLTLLPNLLHEADRQQPTRPSERAADIAPELDEACVRALAPLPSGRLDSAAAIADVIERYLEGYRDEGARKALAASLLASANARVAAGKNDASTRVDAMREAIKALALTPDDVDAQRLLLSLVVDGSGSLPEDAEREFASSDFDVDAHGLRLATLGLSSWFLALPLAMWMGIRDWVSIVAMGSLTLASVVYISFVIRWRTRTTRQVLTMAALLGTTLALSSRWLGPFVLVPVATGTIAMLFAARCTRRERPWILLIWSLALLAPFGVELLHVFPPAYTFQGGDLVLHARALRLPEGPTMSALAYTSLAFMVLPILFLGQLRDRQRNADRRLFVQAWHLRQLFPKGADDKT
jgi:serine/threonine protein kinase